MERQFCINWPALVEEAKLRRKGQKVTQQQLATLAGVSTPTISRFEGGDRDIQLSSVTRILGVLGMIDERSLLFPEDKAHSTGEAVVFRGRDGEKPVTCAISLEALEDHFDADEGSMMEAFKKNRERICHEARRKYLADRLEEDGSVLIKTTDL